MTKAERESLKAEFITGDYRTLKDFALAKGLSYGELRIIASQDKWTRDRLEAQKQITNKTITSHVEKSAKDNLRNLEARQDENLNAINLIRAEVLKNIKGASAKDLNALSSTIYRLAEIESNILGLTYGEEDNTAISITIEDCTKDGDVR